jgi:hypothetical protein
MDQSTAIVVAAGLAALPGSLTVLMAARSKGRQDAMKDRLDDVHDQIVTMNGGTVGSFASDEETRRVEAIPHDERTATEQRHIDQAPTREPPIGPGR